LSLSKTSFPATPGTFALSPPVSDHQDQPTTETPGLVGLKFFRPTRMTGEVHERPRSTTSIVVLKASQLDRSQLSTMGANALVLLVQQRERRGVERVRGLLSTCC